MSKITRNLARAVLLCHLLLLSGCWPVATVQKANGIFTGTLVPVQLTTTSGKVVHAKALLIEKGAPFSSRTVKPDIPSEGRTALLADRKGRVLTLHDRPPGQRVRVNANDALDVVLTDDVGEKVSWDKESGITMGLLVKGDVRPVE